MYLFLAGDNVYGSSEHSGGPVYLFLAGDDVYGSS